MQQFEDRPAVSPLHAERRLRCQRSRLLRIAAAPTHLLLWTRDTARCLPERHEPCMHEHAGARTRRICTLHVHACSHAYIHAQPFTWRPNSRPRPAMPAPRRGEMRASCASCADSAHFFAEMARQPLLRGHVHLLGTCRALVRQPPSRPAQPEWLEIVLTSRGVSEKIYKKCPR